MNSWWLCLYWHIKEAKEILLCPIMKPLRAHCNNCNIFQNSERDGRGFRTFGLAHLVRDSGDQTWWDHLLPDSRISLWVRWTSSGQWRSLLLKTSLLFNMFVNVASRLIFNLAIGQEIVRMESLFWFCEYLLSHYPLNKPVGLKAMLAN